MKKITAVMLSIVIALSICACGDGKLSGTYKDNLGFSTLTFQGNKVEMSSLLGEPHKGKYSIDGNTVSVEYDDGLKDTFIYDKETDTLDYLGVMVYQKEK